MKKIIITSIIIFLTILTTTLLVLFVGDEKEEEIIKYKSQQKFKYVQPQSIEEELEKAQEKNIAIIEGLDVTLKQEIELIKKNDNLTRHQKKEMIEKIKIDYEDYKRFLEKGSVKQKEKARTARIGAD